MGTQDEIWEALQGRVCVRCLDGNGHGECRIAQDGFCALKAYFPSVLDVVSSVQSSSILPYEEMLRLRVCSRCKNQSSTGECFLRRYADCALDRYFPLIVEVIEGTRHRMALAGVS